MIEARKFDTIEDVMREKEADLTIRIAEMFAGVGGFRLALDGYGKPGDEFFCEPAGDFKTVWANQWEPPGTAPRQFAYRCYVERFGESSCVNENVEDVLDQYEAGNAEIPDFDMLVGGFPCQDYSVAKPAPLARGIEGKKGVLWWSIQRLVALKEPRYVLLENVDRLLKSPTKQRGRDFAIILSCLNQLGYCVEWRVINAADYGMPQRRRRVFIYAEKRDDCEVDVRDRSVTSGVLVEAFPIAAIEAEDTFEIASDPYEVSEAFGVGDKKSRFMNAGCMCAGVVWTGKVSAAYEGARTTIADIIVDDELVPEEYFITEEALPKWEYLKGSKRERRRAASGYEYWYSEGPVAFPDSIDGPARTILTGEGGTGASRMKHAIKGSSGRIRRLVPDELDALQMFPKGWTRGMSDGHRAFCMGNALVVGVPHQIGKVIAHRFEHGDK